MKLIILHTIFIISLKSLCGFAQMDSTYELSYKAFLKQVITNHPIAKQANLFLNTADAKLLNAKGNFDPTLFYDYNQKYFNEKNYWTLSNGGIKIPTWFGIELKGGYEQNNGTNINPEEIIPSKGLIYSNITFPISQGLLIDERRAVLKQAQLFQELSVFEKNNLLNEIILKAGKAYWDWQLAYNNLLVFENSVNIASQRLIAVKQSSSLGDRPYIDTLEASIQLQDRILNYQQSQMEYIHKSFILSNFLWLDDNTPIEITNKIIPKNYSSIYENENYIKATMLKTDSILSFHPQLKIYDLKLDQLKIEQKLKSDKLKPIVNINYNPLFDQTNSSGNNYLYSNNYKWGVNFSFPIFLRKQRGELQLTKIKILDTNYELKNKQNEIANKIKANANDYQISKNQIATFSKTVKDYERLWQSEKTLFETGESSLFMVNSREMAFINAQIKLNEIINKNKKAALDTEFAIGQLNTLY